MVTVASVDGPLAAVDDVAQTWENRPVMIDVLANDIGPGLEIVALAKPAHGTARVAQGGLLYLPVQGYHGSDRFVYTVAGHGGGRGGLR